MTRRWAPPKRATPQQELILERRGRFSPPVKIATDTSSAAAASVGLIRGGDADALTRRKAPASPGGRGEETARAGASILSPLPPGEGRGEGNRIAANIGGLASAVVGVLERHSRKVKLSGVMLAITVRKEVLDYLVEHPEGASADEIAYALKYSILTVRPRVSELRRMGKITDSVRRETNASGRKAIVWRVA